MTQATQLGELLGQGGWMMYPIYGCSVLAVAVGLRKLLELRRARLHQTEWLEPTIDSVDAHDYDHARRLCMATPHPAARVVLKMMTALHERPERAEAEAQRLGETVLTKYERNLGLLAFIAEVAPLLGLLGTVVGMVDLFMSLQAAEQGAVAMAALSSGIWKALLTTAAGLAVAVPTMAMHSYFMGRIEQLRSTLETVVGRVLYVAPECDCRPVRAVPNLTPAEMVAE